MQPCSWDGIQRNIGPKFYEYLGKPEALEWDGHKGRCPEDENNTCKGVASLGVRETF